MPADKLEITGTLLTVWTNGDRSLTVTAMKTCSITEAKNSLGRLADAALRGRPTVISRGGKLVVLQAFDPGKMPVQRPVGYFADCYADATDIKLENRCGRASD